MSKVQMIRIKGDSLWWGVDVEDKQLLQQVDGGKTYIVAKFTTKRDAELFDNFLLRAQKGNR